MRLRRLLGNYIFWIVVLLSLILVVNFLLFRVYQQALPELSLPAQLKEYFESDTFAVVTVSLIFPILALVVESRFKIAEKFRADRRERRWRAIEKTSKMWNKLYALTSEVVYLREDTGAEEAGKKDADNDASIRAILKKLRNFEAEAEEIVSMWFYRFRKLDHEDIKHFGVLLNTLLYCASGVASHIQKHGTDDESSRLQASLGVIQVGIDDVAYHAFLLILKYSSEMMERELTKKERADHRARQANLGWWAGLLDSATFADGGKIDRFREAVEEEWLKHERTLRRTSKNILRTIRDLQPSVS